MRTLDCPYSGMSCGADGITPELTARGYPVSDIATLLYAKRSMVTTEQFPCQAFDAKRLWPRSQPLFLSRSLSLKKEGLFTVTNPKPSTVDTNPCIRFDITGISTRIKPELYFEKGIKNRDSENQNFIKKHQLQAFRGSARPWTCSHRIYNSESILPRSAPRRMVVLHRRTALLG